MPTVEPLIRADAERTHVDAFFEAHVEADVEAVMDCLTTGDRYVIPHLHVHLLGSLALASVLHVIQKTSENALCDTGSPWVSLPMDAWAFLAGLSSMELVHARAQLRDCGLIAEHTGFDPQLGAIVTNICFLKDVFEAEVEAYRRAITADACARLRGQGTL